MYLKYNQLIKNLFLIDFNIYIFNLEKWFLRCEYLI